MSSSCASTIVGGGFFLRCSGLTTVSLPTWVLIGDTDTSKLLFVQRCKRHHHPCLLSQHIMPPSLSSAQTGEEKPDVHKHADQAEGERHVRKLRSDTACFHQETAQTHPRP